MRVSGSLWCRALAGQIAIPCVPESLHRLLARAGPAFRPPAVLVGSGSRRIDRPLPRLELLGQPLGPSIKPDVTHVIFAPCVLRDDGAEHAVVLLGLMDTMRNSFPQIEPPVWRVRNAHQR